MAMSIFYGAGNATQGVSVWEMRGVLLIGLLGGLAGVLLQQIAGER